MNLIGSVNIQYPSDGQNETLLSFAEPKGNGDAMKAAEKAIKDDTGKAVANIQRCPPQYGANMYSAYALNNKHLAWITLNEVTVKG